MMKLTDREEQAYLFIRNFFIEHMYSPSVREIAKGMGYGSTSSVFFVLRKLQDKGYIRMQHESPRAMWIKGVKVILDEEEILQHM